ncbi:MAG TPA: helix-turn-helix domain-containing protein [Gaiellaceae bacterium]|nr:helix-turn-helix domain-containing protein [Gaiellaceae bacterium]
MNLEDALREFTRQVVRDELARQAPAWEWLTVAQAAELLGVSPKAVYSKVERGALRPHRFDGRLYLSRRELDDAIRSATP